MKRVRVELLCAGSELLRGQVNTHLARISLRLAAAGLALGREASLPDDQDALAAEIRSALGRCDALIVCGGLGPTFDDLTREAAASALGRSLAYHPAIFKRIRRRFAELALSVPAENKRQAFVLAGAEVLANEVGAAPGQMLTLPARRPGGLPRTLVLLPGPYRELSPMLEGGVLPRLKKLYAAKARTMHLVWHLAGIPESRADERLKAPVARAGPESSFMILSYPGQVDFHAYLRAGSDRRAREIMRRVRRRVLAAVGRFVLWEGDLPLEAVVGRQLLARRLTLAVAESCTGGMIGARLTDVPGSSAYFRGGVVAYSDDLKKGLLGVDPARLARHGAVSEECCREMAEGVRRASGSSVGLSATGIAGPSGGTRAKPVGLVFIGVSGPGPGTKVHALRLSGEREFIRTRATTRALQLLLDSVRLARPRLVCYHDSSDDNKGKQSRNHKEIREASR
ncbi:MAG: CinA family nicotinamide mononucleotide deamidase-related protein [Elusimicrobia bacterium]|nr:CinA family nicotinamide mononucleotide deamidase-related protein [Elusimicrobiota bacterium]